MRTFLGLVLTLVWSVVVFFVTLWVTFPSSSFADRIASEVPLRLGPEYSADVGGVGPWWIGLSAGDVKLYKEGAGVAPPTPEGEVPVEAPPTGLVAMFDRIRVSVSPFSLLRRSPYFEGNLAFVDGSLAYEVGTGPSPKGGITLTDLVLRSEALPVGDVLSLWQAFPGTVDGQVAVDVSLAAGAEGMKDASGHVSITGSDLTVSDIELPDVGPLGMALPISQLELVAEVKGGRAQISTGHVVSPLVTLELRGEVALRDPIDRSSMDLEVVITNLGAELSAFEGFMSSAKGEDGAYHFHCRGVVSRMNANSCTGGDRTVSSTPTRPTRSPRARGAVGAEDGSPMEGLEPEGGLSAIGDPLDDAERQRRREEIRERLRQKREERLAERGSVATDPNAPDPDPIPEEPLPDEDPEEVPLFEDLEEPPPEEVLDEEQ